MREKLSVKLDVFVIKGSKSLRRGRFFGGSGFGLI